MTPPTPTKPTLRGLFWFGCGGGALIIGGIIAVLAANWKEIAFPFQVLIALLPLATALSLYIYYSRRGTLTRELDEVLGILWGGGVLCATALLGRVLQLSSSSFAFCATVTLLLAPVVLALRATSAWMTFAGFALGSALALFLEGLPGCDCFAQKSLASLLAGQALCLAAMALVVWRLVPRWRETGAQAKTERTLAACFLCVYACLTTGLLLCFSGDAHPADLSFPAYKFFPLALPLCVGLWVERGQRSQSHVLTTIGGVLLLLFGVWFLVAGQAFRTYADMSSLLAVGLYAFGSVALLVLCKNRVGAFPICVLPMALAGQLGAEPLVPLALQLVVAIGGIAVALIYASRTLANLSLGYLILAVWVGFVALDSSLMARGLIFICGGLLLLVLNLLFAKFTRNREVPHV
ncbi:MAG: DUF2157 domain-containing protein [Lentisphaeraceae bacterium]|nr:DUF2157 domain-containing protein [Lentisphaeraceae bacterium]